ncbi:hypothetical protein PIB30_070875 [Stylosanthes scabra]|uniref:Uncharacterized protein n=1 Tax=Stylosanthes scabra TaxID=79078 RepID=A0ABU6QNN7_9FABA|nr:hypothetical protein [Stylosanthes scabra]
MFERALCDLGSSINLMPLSLMKKLGIKEIKPTKVILQMTCMKINSVDPASTKPPERSGKTIGTNSQDKESAEDFRSSPSQQKEEAAISPIPAEEDKKKKEPATYMPKPPYPQRLKADNKNKAPKKEPKEENGATNDSVKFQLIQKVPTMPYLPTIIGSNNKTYMITEGVYNKFFEPP